MPQRHYAQLTQNTQAVVYCQKRASRQEVRPNLSSVLFSPCEQSSCAITITHQSFDLPSVHSLCLLAICDAIAVFEVDSMLVQKL